MRGAGCLNGGGQLKPRAGQTSAQLLAALDESYHHPAVVPRQPQDAPLVRQLYPTALGGRPFSEEARHLLHTGYHVRDKPAAVTIATDW